MIRKLKINSDMINKQPKTLIIGEGWVGSHIMQYFTEAHSVDVDKKYHDINGKKVSSYNKYDLSFICVPTPMQPSGKCDTSIVRDVVNKYKNITDLFICKSTVEVGTIDDIINKEKVKMVFEPEFLGEGKFHPNNVIKGDPFIILGGNKESTKKAAEYWSLVTNANATIKQTDAKTAELVKLAENSFLATKVTFFNEFYDLCKKLNIDYSEFRETLMLDDRIGKSHSYVYENNRGFSGKCFCKDINNLVWYSKNVLNRPATFMENVLKYNANLRKKYKNSVIMLGDDIK